MKLELIKDEYFKEIDKRIPLAIALKEGNNFISILPLDFNIEDDYGHYELNVTSSELPSTFNNTYSRKRDSCFKIFYKQLDGSLSDDINEEHTNKIADIRLLHVETGNFRDFVVGTKDWRYISKLEKENKTLYEIFYNLN